METEQAHSLVTHPLAVDGREAALRRPRMAQRAVPVVWLNLVCLDAPLVSVAWLGLFARVFHVTISPANGAALFLTAWLIYLADRLADSYSLPALGPRSLRHGFCLNHRQVWIGALAVIAAADGVLIWRGISHETFVAGAVIGALALTYLVLNYSLGGAWPALPLKEPAIGLLFAAGTLVALFPAFPAVSGSLVCAGVAFAVLCALNCISIAFWERALDETQRKVSVATRYPWLAPHLGKFPIALALCCGLSGFVFRNAALIFGCASLSALLLALLDFLRGRVARDQRTSLADLVLLTPLLAMLV
ncbi:MAG: hypothetical protein M3N12_08760 [Verrucomicrobiota bacterium]|nr:hypothetical protein [Verrucomicrobiota bacterium]